MEGTENTTTPPPLKVTVLSEGKNLYGALGISKERSDELDLVLHAAMDKCQTFTDAIGMASEAARDIQELTYMTYLIGCHSGKQSIMMKTLSKMF